MFAAAWHVLLALCVCACVCACGLFDSVSLQLGYAHYAERPRPHAPALLAMPWNCTVNAAYVLLGAYWVARGDRLRGRGAYLQAVFALMAAAYGPVQWTRVATQRHAPAVLDQWLTLPIFMWVCVWCHFVWHGWRPRVALALVLASLGSYTLALVHRHGFELALGIHVALAVGCGVCTQSGHGDARSLAYLLLALLSCVGFVLLKLLDLPLARYQAFQNLTGHFWSKVCDVMQFHFTCCFLTHVTRAHTA